jgi:hypothetical protein
MTTKKVWQKCREAYYHSFPRVCQRPLPRHKWQRGLLVLGASAAVAGGLYAADYTISKLYSWNYNRNYEKRQAENATKERERVASLVNKIYKVEPRILEREEKEYNAEKWHYNFHRRYRLENAVMVCLSFPAAALLAKATLNQYARFQKQVALCDYARSGVFLTGCTGLTLYGCTKTVQYFDKWNYHDRGVKKKPIQT